MPPELLGASSEADGTIWNPAGVRHPEARFGFAVNTCNGCHLDETGTGFLHVGPRPPCPIGARSCQEASASGFLTGTTVSDPVSGQLRSFADLERRAKDMASLLTTRLPPCCTRCTPEELAEKKRADDAADLALWSAGSARVH